MLPFCSMKGYVELITNMDIVYTLFTDIVCITITKHNWQGNDTPCRLNSFFPLNLCNYESKQ